QTSGQYEVTVIDSNSCNIKIYNLVVYEDTVEIITSDTTVFYCHYGDSTSGSRYAFEYIPKYELPYFTYMIINDTIHYYNSDILTQGEYIIDYYDTSVNCRILRENITVIGTLSGIIQMDTVIGYCGYKYTDTAGCVVYRPSLEFEYKIQRLASDTLYYYDTCLIAGVYLVEIYDSSSCILYKQTLTVYDSLECPAESPGGMELGVNNIF